MLALSASRHAHVIYSLGDLVKGLVKVTLDLDLARRLAASPACILQSFYEVTLVER